MSDDLKPCPFCGGEAEYEFLTDGKKDSHHVGCADNNNCSVEFAASISFVSKEEAITAWNSRPQEDAKDKRIEQLEFACRTAQNAIRSGTPTVKKALVAKADRLLTQALEGKE